jgi:hypothetical protein
MYFYFVYLFLCAYYLLLKQEVCTWPGALITTGGGFSNYVPVPAWQQSVVNTYLNSGVTLPPAGDFNSSNRGFPDVSALGHNYLIAIGGHFEQVDGYVAHSMEILKKRRTEPFTFFSFFLFLFFLSFFFFL